MDSLLADFFELEEGNSTLILATALSQQPYLKHEATGGQRFLRPRDVASLLRDLSIEYLDVQPVMAHQFLLRTADETAKAMAIGRLKAVRYLGQEVFDFSNATKGSVYFGAGLWTEMPADAVVDVKGRQRHLFDLFYQIEEVKSGYHHPDGVLWVKTGKHRRFEQKGAILGVFPAVVDLLGVSQPSRDAAPRPGRSLLPLFSS